MYKMPSRHADAAAAGYAAEAAAAKAMTDGRLSRRSPRPICGIVKDPADDGGMMAVNSRPLNVGNFLAWRAAARAARWPWIRTGRFSTQNPRCRIGPERKRLAP